MFRYLVVEHIDENEVTLLLLSETIVVIVMV